MEVKVTQTIHTSGFSQTRLKDVVHFKKIFFCW